MARDIRKRGLRETQFWVQNPLPEMTETELFAETSLDADMVRNTTDTPFRYNLQYGAGLEKEVVSLDPGERILLRDSEVNELRAELVEFGLAIYENRSDAVARRDAKIDGLRRAERRFREFGKARLVDHRKTHGISVEEQDEMKYDLWAYHLNEAKADACKDEIKSLMEKSRAAA